MTLAGLTSSVPIQVNCKTQTTNSLLSNSSDPLDIHNPCRSNKKKLKSLGLGIVDHLKDSAQGVKEVFTDPKGTLKKMENIVLHPIKTAKNAWTYFTKKCEDQIRCVGEKIGFVASTGLSVAAGSGIGMLAEGVANTAVVANTVGTASKIAATGNSGSMAAVQALTVTQNVVEYGTTVTGVVHMSGKMALAAGSRRK